MPRYTFIQLCEELCEGYEYFGTQDGSECFCGDSKSRLFKHGKSNKCNKNCGGKSPIKKCGGRFALSVFQYEGSPKDIPEDTDYVGCFKDKEKDRALTLKDSTSKKMTYKKCKKTCDKVDAKYFGVQYSKECFCGNSKADYDQHGKGICNMDCAGDPDEICGGFGTMSVFRIT